jgi:hypothetical protein
MKRYEEGDYLFDGFAHRPYNEKYDGWRNALPDPDDYPAVKHAQDVLALFDELAEAKRRIWHLEKEVALYKPLMNAYISPAESESDAQ